jgi:hypothetical protein
VRRRVVALSVLAVLLLPGTAHSAYDPLGSGQAKLVLDKSFVSYMHKAGIKLTAAQGATCDAKRCVLPIGGGQIDPTSGKGQALVEGALIFASQRKKVPLRHIRVKSTRQPLIAKVGGSQLKVAASKKTQAVRSGFGSKLTATKLSLTAKAATRFNKKLRPRIPFEADQLLGTLVADAQPGLVTIEETGKATISLDPAFLRKLDSSFVSLNPVSPAERFGAEATFPIVVGGAIAPDGSTGTLRTGGDLEFLQLGAGQVFWHELWLDLGGNTDSAEVDIEPTPSFPGKIGRVGVLDYTPTTVSSNPKARTISVSGARIALSAQAAGSFNEAFAQGQPPVFAAGESVGTLSFTAQAQ